MAANVAAVAFEYQTKKENNMITKKITVDTELTNYIERLSREVEGCKEVIAFMLENNKSITTDAFKSYRAEYNEVKAEFDLARQDVENKYVPQTLKDIDGANTSWTLDYASSTITITYAGKKFTEDQFNTLFD